MSIAELRHPQTPVLLVETPWGVARVSRPWTAYLRLAMGLVLSALSLLLPWLADPLGRSPRAWDLPLRLGWLPGVDHINYGIVVAVALLTVVVTLGRRSGGLPVISRWGAGVVLTAPLLWAAATRIADAHTAFTFHSQQAQYAAIVKQFGYSVASQNQPTSILGLSADHTTLTLFGALRPGWYLAVIGGAILCVAGRRPHRTLPLPSRRRVALRRVAVGVALTVVVSVLAVALAAQQEKLWGIQSESTGRSAAAAAHLRLALDIDPSLRWDPAVELTLGQIDLDEGNASTALAVFASAVGPQAVGVPLVQRVERLDQSMRLAPGNALIAEYDAELLGQSIRSVPRAAGPASTTSPLVAYTAGRAAYANGDFLATIGDMKQAASRTTNHDIRSSCLTYVALSELGLGDPSDYRRDLLGAIRADTGDHNELARDTAAGLFTPLIPSSSPTSSRTLAPSSAPSPTGSSPAPLSTTPASTSVATRTGASG